MNTTHVPGNRRRQQFRRHRRQNGFTLIELLVVVSILGVLAAVATMSLIGVTANANAKACTQESAVVQTAVDTYMSANNITAVPTPTSPTNSMATPLALYPAYIRQSLTKGTYTWQANGQVTQGTC